MKGTGASGFSTITRTTSMRENLASTCPAIVSARPSIVRKRRHSVVHQDDGHVVLGDDAGEIGIALKAPDVIDDSGPASSARRAVEAL